MISSKSFLIKIIAIIPINNINNNSLVVNPVNIIFVLLSITLFAVNTTVSLVPDVLDNI